MSTTRREADDAAKKKAARQTEKLFGRFKVAATSPFTVYLDGYPTPTTAALKVDGLTYTVGMTGIYFLIQGQKPVCLPTTS